MVNELSTTNDTPEELVLNTPIPDDVMDSVAPEQELATPDVVMPDKIMSKEAIQIRQQIDYINRSAGKNLGVLNEYVDGNPEAVVKAAFGADKVAAMKALQAISVDYRYSIEQRVEASELAYKHSQSNSNDSMIADRGASVMKYAVENELDEDGSLEDRQDIVDQFRNGESAKTFSVEQHISDTDDLAVFRSNLKKGGPEYAIAQFSEMVSGRSKLLSADTLVGFVPTVTELSTDNFYKNLGKVAPEILKIHKDYGFVGSVLARGHRDKAIMDAVAKMPAEKQVKLAESMIEMMKDSSLDSVMAHVNADVADMLFRKVLDPKTGKYSLNDVVEAEGFGNTLGVAMRTPVAEWLGTNIIRPAFAILDYLPALSVAKNVAVNSAKRIVPQMKASVRFFGVVRPSASVDAAVQASQSDEAAKQLGYASREEAMMRMLPSEKGFYTSPEIATNVQERVLGDALARNRIFDEIFSVSNTPMNVSDPQVLIHGFMGAMKGGSIVPNTAYTSIAVKDGAFEVSGIFGKAESEGYSSATSAISTAKKFYGDIPVQAVLRKRTTGQMIHPEDTSYTSLVKDAKENPADYDWWSRVDTTRPVFNIESEVVGSTKSGWWTSTLSGSGRLSKHLTGGLSQLVDNSVFTKSAFVAGNSKFATEQFKKIFDWNHIGVNERKALSAVLYVQNKERNGTLKSSAQLRNEGITSVDGQAAYYNAKIALDKVHSIADHNLSVSLVKAGFMDIASADGVRVAFGKPVGADGLGVGTNYHIRVLDEGKDDVMSMTGASVHDLSKQGYTLYENKVADFAKRTSDGVDVETTHLLVANSIKDRQVSGIRPSGVLNYSAGYIPEIRTGRIAIEGITEGGRKHLIGYADTISEANAVTKGLQTDAKMLSKFPNGIRSSIYKGMANDYQAVGAKDTYENLNGLVYGVKGDEVQNFSGINGDATMLDPLEAISHMTSMLAQQYTKGRHIEYLENLATAHAKKFDLLKITSSSVRSMDDVVGTGGLVGDRLTAHTQVSNFMAHIEAQRLAPDAVDRLSAKAWGAIANWGASVQLPIVGRMLEKFAIKQAQNPVNLLQSLTHFNYFTKIRTNPIKHRVMNVASGLINMAHPMGMAMGLKQRAAFNAAVDFSDSVILGASGLDDALKVPAKSFGISVPELKELVKAYRQGGVYNAADNNVLFRNSIETEAQLVEMRALSRSPKSAHIMGQFRYITGQINKGLAEIGDVAGEREAMLTTFLTQYNTLKNTKGFNIMKQASKEELVGKTMVLSGNMVSEGALGMQKGWLRALFQFHSYTTKMIWNSIVPQSLGGSRLLSAQDKFGMAVTQLMMFGADGIIGAKSAATNMANAWANDKTLSDEEQMSRNKWLETSGVQRAVENGFVGMMLNNYLKSYMSAYSDKEDEYQDLDFTSLMGVLGGASIVENTYRNVSKGFGEAGLIMSAIGGPEGYWEGGKALGGAIGTSYFGMNAKMPANVLSSIMSVSRITGSAFQGEVPLWVVPDATLTAVEEHTVAFSRPMVAMAVSKRYGEEIVNGKPRNRAFEANLDTAIKLHLGLQSIDEKNAYALHEEMQRFTAKNYYGSTGYKKAMMDDARSYVNGLIKDLTYLRNVEPTEKSTLDDAVLDRHGRMLARELSSMSAQDALAYEESVNAVLDDVMSKESIERETLESALALMGKAPASYQDFSYIKNIMGDNPIIRGNPETLDSYINYINNWVEEALGGYEE